MGSKWIKWLLFWLSLSGTSVEKPAHWLNAPSCPELNVLTQLEQSLLYVRQIAPVRQDLAVERENPMVRGREILNLILEWSWMRVQDSLAHVCSSHSLSALNIKYLPSSPGLRRAHGLFAFFKVVQRGATWNTSHQNAPLIAGMLPHPPRGMDFEAVSHFVTQKTNMELENNPVPLGKVRIRPSLSGHCSDLFLAWWSAQIWSPV